MKRDASCVVNALVEATPISGPALVMKERLQIRIRVDSWTLQIPNTHSNPKFLARFKAARVSAVSPDWDIPIIRVLFLITLLRYRNSLAISTDTGIFANSSIQYFATNPA